MSSRQRADALCPVPKVLHHEGSHGYQNREIGTGCIGGKAAGMLLARNILRDEAPELYSTCIEPHDSYYIGADLFTPTAFKMGCGHPVFV